MTSPNKSCTLCGKGYSKAIARSHSMRATIRKLKPNLQWLTTNPGKRVKACTKCIRSVSSGKIKLPALV